MPLVTFLLNLSVTLLKEFPHSLSYSVNRILICINSMFGCNIQFSLTQCTTNEIKEAFKRIVWSSFLFRQVIVGQKCLYFCVDAPQWYQRASSTLQMGVGQSLIFVCLFMLLLWALALFFCTSFCQGTYHCACGERVDSLLWYGSRGLNLHHQAWHQAQVSSMLSFQPQTLAFQSKKNNSKWPLGKYIQHHLKLATEHPTVRSFCWWFSLTMKRHEHC